jgi:signal transduction histidine kinase/CheY-like chemotaxis protein
MEPFAEDLSPPPCRRGRRTIRFWLTNLVLAAIVPGTLVAGYLVVTSYGRERASRERDMIATARALMQVVDTELKGVQTALQVLATSQHLAAGNLEAFHHRAQEALAGRIGSSIVLADASGRQVVNTARPFGGTLPRHVLPDQLQRVLETGRPALSDVFIGPVLGKPMISVEVPVFAGDQVIYALSTGVSAELLGNILQRQNIPPESLAAILDRTGTIAARTRNPEQFVGKKALPALVRRISETAEAALEVEPLDGVPLLAAFARSPTTGWTTAIGVPRASLTADVQRSLSSNAGLAVVLLAFGIAAAHIISRRISASIRALEAPALALGSQVPLPIPTGEIAEVNEVGAALLRASELIREREAERDRAEEESRQSLIAKRAAEAANEAKSQFLGSLSHELRTPLNAISGFAQLLRHYGDKIVPDRQTRYTQNIIDACDQLTKIIDDILDMARVETGQVDLDCGPVDCLEVMSEVYRTLELAAKARGIMFSSDTSATLPPVLADRGRLIQILLNLGSNAIKYNMEGGWVLLAAFPHDGMVRFFVRDTGRGIAPAYHDRVFEAFNRLGAEQGPEEGSGVGLAISRRLAEAMNGHIGFESVVGAGSKFWVDLPIATETAATRTPTMPLALPEDGRFKILYIEDRIPNVEVVRGIIEDLKNIRFLDAQSVRDGIEIARTVKPDIVITDIHLPDGTGFDVLRTLRQDPATAQIHVLALTADAMPTNVYNMERHGFDHILTKPFKVSDLVDVLRTTLKAA